MRLHTTSFQAPYRDSRGTKEVCIYLCHSGKLDGRNAINPLRKSSGTLALLYIQKSFFSVNIPLH